MERLRVCAEILRSKEMPVPRSRLVEDVRSAEVDPALQSRNFSFIRNRGSAVSSFPEASFQVTGAKRENYALPPVMEQRLRGRKMEHRPCRHDDMEEDDYHGVDDQEETHPVRILPPKPLMSDAAYADRLISRSSLPELPASPLNMSQNIPPRLPKRNIQGPSVDRSLKPGKKQNSQTSGETKHLGDTGIQDIQPPRLPKRVVKELRAPSPVSVSPKARRATHADRRPKTETGHHQTVMSRSPVNGTRREARPMQTTFSQDLEFCRESWSAGSKLPATGTPSVSASRHHEWPPTRGDMKTYGHHAKPRPAQISSDQSWYIGACERANAEHALHLMNTDGAFLVRDHSKSSAEEPFVLSLLSQRRVFNIKIRFIKSARKYALGTGLRTNDMFDSVDAIIRFHMIFPIVLIDGKDQSVQRKCTLTCPLTKDEVDKILGQ
ncbi:lymphocyte cytosolic protein 2 isoform X2 [Anguilla anguilla]|nr:lymphocyte cytosolic protein 2 isoform X2 [Anguilla anguilla]